MTRHWRLKYTNEPFILGQQLEPTCTALDMGSVPAQSLGLCADCRRLFDFPSKKS